ncbi:MAG: hypothetical protein UMU75_07615 [Halomonas sp.]|nr:hypothetical protein [Halomonas sp.]
MPSDTPRDVSRAAAVEQRKATLIDAIRQAHVAGEEETSAIIDGLGETERWYIKAFASLSRTRATEPHLEPISAEEMTAYMEAQTLPVEPDEFMDVIHALDRAWLDTRT